MRPSIAMLRTRLTLQARQRTSTDGGGAVVAWATIASMFANVSPVSGREIVAADGRTGRVSHEIMLRYCHEVQPGMHFVDGARVFIIHAAIDLDGRRRWMKCLCEERLP